MNICVIGTGYVGLVTGTCFAEMGNNVWCVDQDEDKVRKLKNGIVPIYEPGLKELIQRNVNENRLIFTTNIVEGIKEALFCFIAVGTPPSEDGRADLSHVLQVAQDIGRSMKKYMIIVNKSTVPVGTAKQVHQLIGNELSKRDEENIEFDVVSNPEFFKEGMAVEDCLRPDRIVIGVDNIRTAELMKELYTPFVRNQHPILIMDTRSAEMTKYAANAMLAARISFMNELARLCDKIDADITHVQRGIGTDRRIGPDFLYAGAGFGGSCFPKDIEALIHTGQQNNIEMEIISAVASVNAKQKLYLVEMIEKKFGRDLQGLVLGIWGLAFKPQTDDIREATSVVLIKELLARGAKVKVYDPKAMGQARILFGESSQDVVFSSNELEAVTDADAAVLVTEWRQFRQLSFAEVKDKMRQRIIFDGRNQYSPDFLKKMGFEYYCIGRGKCVR